VPAILVVRRREGNLGETDTRQVDSAAPS
jgi:hypothetical protein